MSAMLLASMAEAIGLIALFPLFSLFSDQSAESNRIVSAFKSFFQFLNIEMSVNAIISTILLLTAFGIILTYFALKLTGNAMTDIGHGLRLRIMKALMEAEWPCFKTLSIGRLTNAVGHQVHGAEQTYWAFCKILSELILMLTFFVGAAIVSWKFSLITLVVACCIAFALRKYFRVLRKAGHTQTTAMSELSRIFTDNLSVIKAIKAMGRSQTFLNNLDHQSQILRKAKRRQVSGEQGSRALRECAIIILITGGVFFSYNILGMPLIEIGVFAILFRRIMSRFTVMQNEYHDLMIHQNAYWSVLSIIEDAENKKEVFSGSDTCQLSQKIELRNISFSYCDPETEREILTNFSALFPAHKFNLIQGPSGIGKTTLVDMLLGLQRPIAGQIFFDDTPMEQINMEKWRSSIGYVIQDTPMLHDTIYENIVLGKSEFKESEIWNVLDMAGASDFVAKLPEGIYTSIGENGSLLSGGEKQKIALARAIITQPQLLILDEATSALDREAADQILTQVKKLTPLMTVIAISHDSAIREYADNICELG